MRYPFNLVAAVNRRLRQSRPASVLILCVALLVLLALIGTAMISTTRTDRYSAQQHTNNTEVDLLVDGVKDLAKSAIVTDLWDTHAVGTNAWRYRPANSTLDPNCFYDHYDYPLPGTGNDPHQTDEWMASRYPQPLDIFKGALSGAPNSNPAGAASAGSGNPVLWPAVTGPLCAPLGSAAQFESPAPIVSFVGGVQSAPIQPYTLRLGDRTFMAPTGYSIGYSNGTITYPALQYVDPNGGGDMNKLMLAADADGDGIADAGLVKLPVGQINGLTYYAGIRIVDNCAAINVNSAWSRLFDFTGTYNLVSHPYNRAVTQSDPDVEQFAGGTLGGVAGFYRTDVGLLEMLTTYSQSTFLSPEMDALNGFRFGNVGTLNGNTAASIRPTADPDYNSGTQTFSYTFTYADQSDALENGLARRIDNPDFNLVPPNVPPASAADNVYYKAFSRSDQAALAYHFCLTSKDATTSDIETALKNSLVDATSPLPGSATKLALYFGSPDTTPPSEIPAVPSSPYAPGALANSELAWFEQNFDWDQKYTTGADILRLPLRSVLVTRNPVSNLSPAVTNPMQDTGTVASAISPLIGSVEVPPSGSGTPDRTLSGMANPYYSQSTTVSNSLGNTAQILVPQVPRTDINKATFNELWRAYWSVMADYDPVKTWRPPFLDNATPNTDGRMFRSPCRNLLRATVTLNSSDKLFPKSTFSSEMTMQLRSALAAVNAIQLRSHRDDVIGYEIPIYDLNENNTTPTSDTTSSSYNLVYTARVYGTTRQPYISEVYVNTYTADAKNFHDPAKPDANDGKLNANGYIAIELYNPYTTPLVLNHWAVGIIDRTALGTINPLQTFNGSSNQDIGPNNIQVVTPAGAQLPTGQPASVALPISTIASAGGYGPDVQFLGGGSVTIPPLGRIILENYPPGGTPVPGNVNDAQYRPPEAETSATKDGHDSGTTNVCVYVPNLGSVIGREMVLFRPHHVKPPPADRATTVDTTGTVSPLVRYLPDRRTPGESAYDEGTVGGGPRLQDFVPIDSYDFTGLALATGSAGEIWHYVRPNNDGQWKFVYPGLYMPNRRPRQEATDHSVTWPDPAPQTGEPQANNVGLTNEDSDVTSAGNTVRTAATTAFPFPPIQLLATDWPGYGAAGGSFPFGAFARNGDILQVPFIGAYEIRQVGSWNTANVMEINALPMDCSYVDAQFRNWATGADQNKPVDDASAGYDPAYLSSIKGPAPYTSLTNQQFTESMEHLGRFCPIPNITGANPAAGYVDDYDYLNVTGYWDPMVPTNSIPPDPHSQVPSSTNSYWLYHFSARLFDYLTVQSPASDYKPNVDPLSGGTVSPVRNGTGAVGNPYGTVIPQTNNGEEYTTGVDGLININTAPWWLIAQLPLLPNEFTVGAPDANKNGIPDNVENLAKDIVIYRDGVPGATGAQAPHGPFRSIMQLNDVTDMSGNPIFRDAIKIAGNNPSYDFAYTDAKFSSLPLNYDAKNIDGDESPHGGADGVFNDFEEQFLMVNRLSNLITTRSDSYTVYIVVQGWSGAGTATPRLVVQRRAAFMIDRNPVTGSGGSAKITNIPTD